ncbi:amino acid ABC transporter permease [Brevibacillus daliensis]
MSKEISESVLILMVVVLTFVGTIFWAKRASKKRKKQDE